jgi:hypothetical protein
VDVQLRQCRELTPVAAQLRSSHAQQPPRLGPRRQQLLNQPGQRAPRRVQVRPLEVLHKCHTEPVRGVT